MIPLPSKITSLKVSINAYPQAQQSRVTRNTLLVYDTKRRTVSSCRRTYFFSKLWA